MENSTEVRGRDVAAPIENITIDGVAHKLVFNNEAARVAEDIYEEYYGKDVGYGEILRALGKSKYSAAMALFYGAMVAGGFAMPWPEFDEKFKLDSIDGMKEIIMRGIEKYLPKATPEEEPENP